MSMQENHRARRKASNAGRSARADAIPPKVRREVMQRDGSCRLCGRRGDLHIHHIDYRSQGGSHEPHNLIALCPKHHEVVHSDKKKFQPLCRGVIWAYYVLRRKLTLDAAGRIVEQ
jgi:5-methylcytosine-specific restriction endonuclease McrA